MHAHSRGRRALACAIAATLALGALAGTASAATGDGSSDLHVRKAGGEKTAMVDPGGGGESIIGVL